MPNHAESPLEVRLDKWLWAARFYKTRSVARDQIDGGKVHYNGQRTFFKSAVGCRGETAILSPSDVRMQSC